MELIFHGCTIRSVLWCELTETERHFGVMGGACLRFAACRGLAVTEKTQSEREDGSADPSLGSPGGAFMGEQEVSFIHYRGWGT